METRKYLSKVFEKISRDKKSSNGINSAMKVFAVSALALFAFGVFTTSQRLNAG